MRKEAERESCRQWGREEGGEKANAGCRQGETKGAKDLPPPLPS